jgi:limonene-1,2-epoxide hydrolase
MNNYFIAEISRGYFQVMRIVGKSNEGHVLYEQASQVYREYWDASRVLTERVAAENMEEEEITIVLFGA